MAVSNISSKATKPVVTKFNVEPPGVEETITSSSHDKYDTIHGKSYKKSFSPKPIDRWPRNLVCSIWYSSTTTIIHLMTLGWHWPFYGRVKYGKMLEHEISWKFWNFCLKSGIFSCFISIGHSLKIVKVILWLLTQDSWKADLHWTKIDS